MFYLTRKVRLVPTLYEVLSSRGLLGSLKLCLDAADILSYSSGQSFLDRSGGGYDFFLGATSASAADDPTFNGVAGARSSSEYFSFDGGDSFRYDSASETWMDAMHQDSGLVTVFYALYAPATLGSDMSIIGTTGGAGGSRGLQRESDGSGVPRLRIIGGSVTRVDKTATTAYGTSAWNLCALSYDEAAGAGGSFFWRNGSYNQVAGADTFDGTNSSPDAGAAGAVMEVGALGNANTPLRNGSRIACLAVWQGVDLTKAQLDDIWTDMRGRFGL